MSSKTIDNFDNTCLSTPRRSKNIEDETIALAPDARRAVRKQLNIEFINAGEWCDELDNLKNENFFENMYEKNVSTPLPKVFSISSLNTKHLITPKRGLNRDSILSTGTPRGKTSQYYLDLTYECVSICGNDSDPESSYEKDHSPIKNIDINENIKNASMEKSEYYNSRILSLCKRSRDSLEFDAGSDSPTELVQIMSKSLRLS
ncbi:unnamed protein product [Cryptosporidium hominis]|uniref:Uncharacterized protein n=1 Tax=Cryptosporidium hominis TaxID=237895 RepID=A0A0S4TDD3_CRYHO|nr:hypothetical protein [Cryptosporidium hominis TU502]OLQ16173.1 hypothetical protein ChTU502y2012_369g0020 [Cryptosporidium hominis]PPA64378.1 hypothetical protein ChUKH1_07570 [Cryptosporidium hominis]PPS92289.1 Uncharacterized protein GY17_00003951 [Cryptosporidium hominis]CUV05374.1 unnamed protein product [Cryptosporidium hominis]|eukprot:PPS92289.1 Uncharacterized protein GY17_00003951 [Cryptosporidium hominis]